MNMTHEEKVLKNAGLKITQSRLAVLRSFSGDCKPISAENIFKKIDTDLVTVYRTLNSFEKAGIIKKVDLRKDSAQYELAHTHHHHIVCTDCGKTEDFEKCGVETIS